MLLCAPRPQVFRLMCAYANLTAPIAYTLFEHEKFPQYSRREALHNGVGAGTWTFSPSPGISSRVKGGAALPKDCKAFVLF